MTLLIIAAAAAAFAAYGFFSLRRLLTFLHIFQQEEYDNRRFTAWLGDRRAFDRRASLALAAAGVAALVLGALAGGWALAALLLAAAAVLAGLGAAEADPRRTGKKPLALTLRARRILGLAWALGIVAAAGAAAVLAVWSPGGAAAVVAATLAGIVLVQVQPLLLTAANRLLAPYERRVNDRFLGEARDALARLRPTVVAITGSYGKTSTKQILAHVLSTVAPTLATPGSVNTPLGIARIVREQLKPQHRFFIAEMGAYGPGSIARLCDLAPPDLAAITAVGDAHYERFRSLETVADAKFEIATAALARGGHVVVNADQVERRFHGPRVAGAPGSFTLVTTDAGLAEPGADAYVIQDAEQTVEGIALTLRHGGESHRLAAPLYGLHHCANVAVAFVLARRLGVPAESIAAALRSTPQVQHRLQVIRAEGRPTLIDDAYNSNPVGFASALALLDRLGAASGGRCVLVTPGMVELGARHDAEHLRIGKLAGDVVDLALVIGPERIPSFLDGFGQGSREGRALHRFPSFAEAKRWLDANAARDDVVLIENDLPDLYERRVRL